MKCPNCEEVLVMSERQGIEIDYCPTCRGVWLDRGELDKIIEKSAADQSLNSGSRLSGNEKRDERYNTKDWSDGGNKDYNKRRGGFLSDLFD